MVIFALAIELFVIDPFNEIIDKLFNVLIVLFVTSAFVIVLFVNIILVKFAFADVIPVIFNELPDIFVIIAFVLFNELEDIFVINALFEVIPVIFNDTLEIFVDTAFVEIILLIVPFVPKIFTDLIVPLMSKLYPGAVVFIPTFPCVVNILVPIVFELPVATIFPGTINELIVAFVK